MAFKIEESPLLDAFIITQLNPYNDSRGSFERFFCTKELAPILKDRNIKNINFAHSTKKGTLRGLHFQSHPMEEVKFVKCLRGRVVDVIVDLRKNSPTFLKHFMVELDHELHNMIMVPEGFAHGYQTLTENAELVYFTTQYYSKEHEGGVLYNDPLLSINWPLVPTDISEKDLHYSPLTKS